MDPHSMNNNQIDFNYEENEGLEFKHYFSLFINNWYWFAAGLFIGICIAYGVNRWSQKTYAVSSTLLIKGEQDLDVSNIFPGSNAYRSQQNLKNEIGILKSFKLNHRVIEDLPDFYVDYIKVGKRGIAESRMYKRCPFMVDFDSIKNQILGKKIEITIISTQKYILKIPGKKDYSKEMSFNENYKENGFDFTLKLRNNKDFAYNPKSSNRYTFSFLNPVSLTNLYRNKLSIEPIEAEASFVTLATTGFVPEQEADYLNKLMDVYLEFGLEYKNQTAAQTIDFIEEQLHTVSDSLKLAEADLEGFRLNNNIIDISREGSLIQNKLEEVDAERSKLVLQEYYYEYLREYISKRKESGDLVAPSIMGVTDQLLINLVNELTQFQQQKKLYSINLDESTEPMIVLDEKIQMARDAITDNVNNGLENVRKLIQNSDKKLSEIEMEIKKLPSTEKQMINIQRKFDINNTVYTFLLEKRAEAGINRASNIPDNRIIDYAGAFSTFRIKPKERQNIMIALVLGFILPGFIIILIDKLNNKILDKKDLDKLTKVPVIGYINHNSSNTELPVIENPGSTLAESFRLVRTNLKYYCKDSKCPIIAISSTVTAEGKTFMSMNLAAIIALSGKKVLLIGLDLRRPRIHRILGLKNDTGMTNYLVGDFEFEKVIQKTHIENLWYAPSGQIPPNPSELIESTKMSEFISISKDRFDFIIIDTPPIAIVTDALLVADYADLYLFVVRQRYTSKNTIELVEELRRHEKMKALSIVMNDISTSGYYGYGLRYGYYGGYNYYYGNSYYNKKYGYSKAANEYYIES